MKNTPFKKETVSSAIYKTSVINIFARGLGYLKNVAIAVLLGFSLETDIFFLTFALIGIFYIFVDVFDSVGIPALVKARQESYEKFVKLTETLFSFTLVLASVVTIIAFIIKPLVIKIAVGFDAQKLNLMSSYYDLLLPYLFFSFFFHHFGAIHRSVRHFSIYFIGELIFAALNLIIIVFGLILYKKGLVLPVALSISMLFSTLYMLFVSKSFLRLAFKLNRTIKKFLKEFFTLIFVYGVFHMFILVDRAFASLLPVKSISALSYGLMVASIPRGIFRLEQVLITPLAEAKASLDKVNFYLKRIILFSIPTSIGIFVFSPALVEFLFGHGAFTRLDSQLTTIAAKFYSFSLAFMFMWPVLFRVYQIRREVLKIVPIATLGVIANGVLNYIFLVKLNMGLIGICLGTLGAYAILVSLSYMLLTFNIYCKINYYGKS